MKTHKCTEIYQDLMAMLDQKPNVLHAEHIVEHIQNTSECDSVVDFSHVRKTLIFAMGTEIYKRLASGKASDNDLIIGTQVLERYKCWTRHRAYLGLPWYSKLTYRLTNWLSGQRQC